MIINDRNIKTWSLIGQRATFGLIALEVVKEREELLILTSDVSTSAGLDRFKKNHPNNFIDVGIAEQNLIGIASGLASENFKVVTYTGNGSTQSITSLGFQPDWTLIKNRSTGDWCNQNSSLGVGKSQKWNDDGGVSSDTDAVTSFNSDGFSLGADSKVNTSSANYVAYCWKKSAEAGLDIVTYSGGGGSQAVSHSLGVTPDCIFIMLNTGTALDSIMYLNSASMGTSYGIFPTLANAKIGRASCRERV